MLNLRAEALNKSNGRMNKFNNPNAEQVTDLTGLGNPSLKKVPGRRLTSKGEIMEQTENDYLDLPE